MLPLARGAKLDGYILGIKKCPEEFIIEGDKEKKNPAHDQDWVTNDQQHLGWLFLFNSMRKDIATQLLHCETSKELWDEAQSLAGLNIKS